MDLSTPPSAVAVVEPVDLQPPVDSAVVSFARATRPAILETSLGTSTYGRFSIFACDPVDEFVHDRRCKACPFRSLADRVGMYPSLARSPIVPPLAGGWIGFFTYEAGLAIEGITDAAPPEQALPLAAFRLYDAAAVYDRQARQWYVTAVDWPMPLARRRPSAASRLAALRDRLASAAQMPPPAPPPVPASSPAQANMSRRAYFARVNRAKRYIEAGDVYQVNLTQRLSTHTDVSPLELYRRLRKSSPSSHAAFLPFNGAAILSSSPELFLDLRNGHVVTRPIKGTRPRSEDPQLDAIYRHQLRDSDKERAELNMIIDLLRNDLGRVCSFGSVHATNTGEIEEHPTVFHRVATIEGDLAPGRDWLHLLLASFPGGSITGAPKIRAMQIIGELEPTPRGVYCGSIGWIGLDGSMSLNIAIRTMVQTKDMVRLYAGGAIVADSTPQQEYDETLAKAAGMLRSLACGPPVEHEARQEVMMP